MAKIGSFKDKSDREYTLRLVEQGDRYDSTIRKTNETGRQLVQIYMTKLGSEVSPEGEHLGLFKTEMFIETALDICEIREEYTLDGFTGLKFHKEELEKLEAIIKEWVEPEAAPAP